MLKFAICNETFNQKSPEYDWAETCGFVAEAGYQGIEIAPFTLNKDVRDIAASSRRAYRDTAHQNGLTVVGLHWLLVSPEGLSLTASDEAIRAETGRYLAALTDFCADVDGRILVLGSPKQRRIAPGTEAHTATDRLMRGLEPALERCALHGLTMCLEPLPAPEADLILTLKEATDVLARMQHPNLKTILDVKSASSETESIPDLARTYAASIAHVHANDANRRGPGFGDTDFYPVLDTLNAIAYNGFISVEVFDYTPDPQTIARQSLAYLQRCSQHHG